MKKGNCCSQMKVSKREIERERGENDCSEGGEGREEEIESKTYNHKRYVKGNIIIFV